MYISILKNAVIYLSCFYILRRISRVNLPLNAYRVLSIIFSVFLGLETFMLKQYLPETSYFLPTLTFTFIVFFFSHTPSLTHFSLPFIVACINLLSFELFSLLVLIIAIPFIRPYTDEQLNLLAVLSCLLYAILINIVLKKTHLCKRVYNFKFNCLINAGTILSLITMFIFSLMQAISANHLQFFYICAIFTPLILILLTLWWRSQITKSYRAKLRILEMEKLRATQREQEQYIAQLEEDNQRMGRIIHKDNRIITAMADSVTDFLQNANGLSPSERDVKGQAFAKQIQEIRQDRQALLTSNVPAPSAIPQTGQVGIDAMVTYMAKEASLYGIGLSFHFDPHFFAQGQLCMEEKELTHLLSDLLANAMIATRHAGGKTIELSMHNIKGTPTIAVADSGIPFGASTYMNLGLQPASTHLDEGGSGIGLMDIWSLKEKYKATLYIEETAGTESFTKRIILIFDRKNRYIISSERRKNLQRLQSRTDLLLVEPSYEIT